MKKDESSLRIWLEMMWRRRVACSVFVLLFATVQLVFMKYEPRTSEYVLLGFCGGVFLEGFIRMMGKGGEEVVGSESQGSGGI